jgi:hypothetical protein
MLSGHVAFSKQIRLVLARAVEILAQRGEASAFGEPGNFNNSDLLSRN